MFLYNMNDNSTNKLKLGSYDIHVPKSTIISPTANDYTSGYFYRYFVSNITYDNIVEVTNNEYKRVTSPLYIKYSLPWKIKGAQHNIYKNGVLTDIGVYEFNLKEINRGNIKINGLSSLLNDPLQFWKL